MNSNDSGISAKAISIMNGAPERKNVLVEIDKESDLERYRLLAANSIWVDYCFIINADLTGAQRSEK